MLKRPNDVAIVYTCRPQLTLLVRLLLIAHCNRRWRLSEIEMSLAFLAAHPKGVRELLPGLLFNLLDKAITVSIENQNPFVTALATDATFASGYS